MLYTEAMDPLPAATPDEQRDRLVFYPVAAAGFVFCLTVFAIIAAAFADPQAPVARWLNAHAIPLMLWEAAAVIVISILAMSIDRIRTLRKERAPAEEAASSLSAGATADSKEAERVD